VFFAREIIQLFSVVLFVVRAMHNFYLVLVINEKINYVMP